MHQSVFIDADNAQQYLDAVLAWLSQDYYEKGEPDRHFWHNRETISRCFQSKEAMIALNPQQEVVGYMIWSSWDPATAEIDIIEVKTAYRRQGISRMMQADFLARFPEVCLLTASVIPESKLIFQNAGWSSMLDMNRREFYYRATKPGVQPVNMLPAEGKVIALSSENFYQVRQNKAKYAGTMQYFPIELVDQNQLQTPIITPFHHEGYMAVYFNGQLLDENKGKYLFNNRVCVREFFILSRFQPKKYDLFECAGFFAVIADRPVEPEQQLPSNAESMARLGVFAHGHLATEEASTQPSRKKSKTTPDAQAPEERRLNQ